MLAVVMVVAAAAAAAGDASTPPAFIQQALPEATLHGQGQMRFLGLRIYDARLWAGPRFEAADFGACPLALELRYHRAFTGAAIAQRSLEEIERQGALGIWLSPRTSEPGLRSALLARKPEAGP